MIAEPFKEYSEKKLRQYTERIGICLGKLSEDQIWARGHESENSAGNLCLHLAGNIRQWVLSGVGGEPDLRDRDSEFAAKGGVDRAKLLARLDSTVDEVCAVVRGLTPERLVEIVRPQGYELTVLEAIYHIVEHFAYHAGQILFLTKALTGEDLGLYRHLSNNALSAGEKHP